MYILDDICNNLGILESISIFNTILKIILILAPIIVLLLSTVDLMKAVTGSADALKKASTRIGKRLIILVVIFMLPTIVNIIVSIDLGDKYNLGAGYFTGECWENANEENIAVLRKLKEAADAVKKAAEKAAKEAEQKELAKHIKKLEELKKSTSKPPGLTFNENAASGSVRVEGGKFYVPNSTSGLAGSKGTAPYGLNEIFNTRLKAYLDAASRAGYKITITDGWRSYEAQVACRKAKGDICATPGRSMHGWGVAADLNFNGKKAATDWAHRNAEAYGLRFSVCKDYFGGVCKENWHIEPLVIIRT